MIKKYYFPNLLSVDMADLFISRYKIDPKGTENKDIKTMYNIFKTNPKVKSDGSYQ